MSPLEMERALAALPAELLLLLSERLLGQRPATAGNPGILAALLAQELQQGPADELQALLRRAQRVAEQLTRGS
ncbi:MAG: hypothetical protein U1A78_33810 [Polyangia bacterium]